MNPMTVSLLIGALLLNCRVVIIMGVNIGDIESFDDIVLLVSDVQDYYKAASVFIVYSGDDESVGTMTLLHRLQREFSGKFVPSSTLNYTDIKEHHDTYRDHIVKPLFVVLLASSDEIVYFQQLTSTYDMSYAVWIVIFTDATFDICYQPKSNYFNVAFDTEMLVKCHNDPVIREWYSLHEDQVKINNLARWDPHNRLQLMTEESLYERRHSLEGKNLPIVIVKESKSVAELEGGNFAGYFAAVLHELSATLNFSVTIAYKENYYGLFNQSMGQWTGAIGRLAKGEVELAISEFTMTKDRLDVVDFTPPILLSRNLLFLPQPEGSALNWYAYLRVYAYETWITIKGLWIFSFIIITIIRVNIKGEKCLPPDHISQNCLQSWGILVQQGLPELPKQSSMRIAYYSVLLKSLVLYSVYSACLISYLTITTASLPFNDFEGFAQYGSYKFITQRECATFDLVTKSNDPVMQKVKTMMPDPSHLPRTVTDSFKQMCEDKAAFYSDGSIKNLVDAQIPCAVVSIDVGRIDSIAMAFKKKSNYRDLINYHLLKFMGSGIMHRMRSQVYRKVSPAENKYVPVNFYSIFPILVLLAAGYLLSVIILCIEIIAVINKPKVFTDCRDNIVVTKNLSISR